MADVPRMTLSTPPSSSEHVTRGSTMKSSYTVSWHLHQGKRHTLRLMALSSASVQGAINSSPSGRRASSAKKVAAASYCRLSLTCLSID